KLRVMPVILKGASLLIRLAVSHQLMGHSIFWVPLTHHIYWVKTWRFGGKASGSPLYLSTVPDIIFITVSLRPSVFRERVSGQLGITANASSYRTRLTWIRRPINMLRIQT